MKYTEEMILQSDSGYCMPFEEQQGKDVELSLGYGEQTDPATGEKFFHHGIDFNVRCYMLSALASGIVSGVGNDSGHGICQTIRYGEYEVTYGNLSNVFAQFGQRVKAGQTVALSGDKLHMTVRFKGEELNTEQSLRHIFTVGAMKEYFYENMPSMANPLGLGHKAMPLACKVQNLLIADFLHYLALRHDVYLSTASSDIKKNSMTKP
ncbi:M23 family metallopeptidase [Bacteroides sp.]|uniref:M23 family metallopeptidase n=1 Tax=Bacteroides sp. TaxID=29523 RepID=UPI00258A2CA9|nr:M23 family metallopeptidase [Bacteroides sp.]